MEQKREGENNMKTKKTRAELENKYLEKWTTIQNRLDTGDYELGSTFREKDHLSVMAELLKEIIKDL
jgi:hypothetical protein